MAMFLSLDYLYLPAWDVDATEMCMIMHTDPRSSTLRNSFEAVPRELEEAAIIDGCSSWQLLNRSCLPAIRPAIVTVSLFAFVTSWNEFLAALVIMNRGVTGITISVIPCILFYVLLQKYYVSGFLSGAVK
jgi:multiple sugar transport system permease protein